MSLVDEATATPTYDGDEHGGNTRQETVNDKGIVFCAKSPLVPRFCFNMAKISTTTPHVERLK